MSPTLTLSAFQKHIADRYEQTDRARGTPKTFLWFIEEVGELSHARARGGVESMGFQGRSRPGCWRPMVGRLVPTPASVFTGRIEVIQEDLARAQVIFARQIALAGTPPNGSPLEQRFWMYFMPQPK